MLNVDMGDLKQTRIDSFFKSLQNPSSTRTPKFKDRTVRKKRSMSIIGSDENQVLSQMRKILNEYGLNSTDLPYPLPIFSSSKETTTQKNYDSRLSLTRNKENLKKKCDSTKKPVTLIGVHSPKKKTAVNASIENLDETILVDSDEYISTNFMDERDLQTSISTIKVIENTLPETSKIPPKNGSKESKTKMNASTSDTPTKSKEVLTIGKLDNDDWNPWVLDFVQNIIEYVFNHKSLNKLLTDDERSTLDRFLQLPKKEYRFFCIKLFTRQRKWYNILKLRTLVKLDMFDREAMNMYSCLSEQGFADTDYSSESIDYLLEHLSAPDIRELCRFFKLSLRPPVTKDAMTTKLKIHCSRQSTLTFAKSIKEILFEKIKEKMGHCVRINADFLSVLQKVHLLYKFVTSEFPKISDFYLFLSRIKDESIIMPDFTVNDDYEIFSSIPDFSSFQRAHNLREEVYLAIDNKQESSLHQLCSTAYEELKAMVEIDISDDRPSCIRRFTPGYQYCKALSTGLNQLTKGYPDDVSEWLRFLLQQPKYCKNLTGQWYSTLLKVQVTHLKQYEAAINTVVTALQTANLSEIDLRDLNARAESIKRGQKFKISQLQLEQISILQPILTEDFPFIEIDSKAYRSDVSGRKRNYFEKTENGTQILSVEDVALNHYFKNGFCNGLHCEGAVLVSSLFVLLWDIIYGNSVPYAFINDFQYFPLDLMTKEFYLNRKEDIDKRLGEIEVEWSLEKLKEFVCDIWINYSNKKSFISINIVDEGMDLFNIILCIGRLKLRKILERLVKDFRNHRAGLPDLFLWNVEQKNCKFVEVKGENDKLSSKQKCWLNFLRSIDADIEVCHVHTMGSKRKARVQRPKLERPTKKQKRTKKEKKMVL